MCAININGSPPAVIRSMTAFARQQQQTEWGTLSWELRSVNHRYLEVSLRLPEELRALEGAVREHASAQIARGKLDCNLRLQTDAGIASTSGLHINHALVKAVTHACREVEGLLEHPAPLNALDILRWPGVVEAPQVNQEQLATQALALLDQALAELVATREREGARLETLIVERCQTMQTRVAEVRMLLPQIHARLRVKLTERVLELKAGFDPARMEQEMLLLLQKIDVDEELTRLNAHLDEVLRVLGAPAPAGRRLDFLMQELNREANTLGSKSADVESARAAIDLKVLIEQVREQIQNIE